MKALVSTRCRSNIAVIMMSTSRANNTVTQQNSHKSSDLVRYVVSLLICNIPLQHLFNMGLRMLTLLLIKCCYSFNMSLLLCLQCFFLVSLPALCMKYVNAGTVCRAANSTYSSANELHTTQWSILEQTMGLGRFPPTKYILQLCWLRFVTFFLHVYVCTLFALATQSWTLLRPML